MSVFKELYYRMYWYVRRIKTETDRRRAESAYLLICLLQNMNVAMMYGIINLFFKIKLERNGSIWAGILVMAILLFVNRFYLYNQREEIFEKYEHETPKRRKRGKILFWLYVVGSLFLFFYFGETLIRPTLR